MQLAADQGRQQGHRRLPDRGKRSACTCRSRRPERRRPEMRTFGEMRDGRHLRCRDPLVLVRVRGPAGVMAPSVREGQSATAALTGASWLLRSKNGDGVDGEHAMANVASRSRASGKPGECRSAGAVAGDRNLRGDYPGQSPGGAPSWWVSRWLPGAFLCGAGVCRSKGARLPICCATRRIESASMPVSSRGSRAALTISRARGSAGQGAGSHRESEVRSRASGQARCETEARAPISKGFGMSPRTASGQTSGPEKR